jgi:hypothetical protein
MKTIFLVTLELVIETIHSPYTAEEAAGYLTSILLDGLETEDSAENVTAYQLAPDTNAFTTA